MARFYGQLENVPFKAVPGGYLFQYRHNWPFGPAPCYFVTGPQKAEIAGALKQIMRRTLPVVLGVGLLLAVCTGVTLWLLTSAGASQPTRLIAMILLYLGILVPYTVLARRHSWRILQPLLAGLPAVMERITLMDRSKNLAATLSWAYLGIMLVLFALNFGFGLVRTVVIGPGGILKIDGAITGASVCTNGFVLAYCLFLIILKIRSVRSSL